MNVIKEQFIKNVIEVLGEENEERFFATEDSSEDRNLLDIPFMIAPLEQKIEAYEDFMQDLETHEYIVSYSKDATGGYTNGKITISFYDYNKDNKDKYYRYIITFMADYVSDGYCMCTDGDEGYNHEYKCCGKNCDWDKPVFTMEKIKTLGIGYFDGLQRDYWEHKKEINNKIELEKKNRRIKILEDRKEELRKELAKVQVQIALEALEK